MDGGSVREDDPRRTVSFPMTILAFGYHDRQSPRYRTVCEALTADSGSVIECHTDKKGFSSKCGDLRKKFRTLSPRVLSPSRVERLEDTLLNLEKLDDARKISRLLVP